ncbi:peptide chain release factor 2, partial [Candidatus Cerribacteria bacterium 'Amazon FNV 2010 28 9']
MIAQEHIEEVQTLAAKLEEIRAHLDVEGKEARISELETQSADPSVWQDQEKAKAIGQEMGRLKRELEMAQDASVYVRDLNDLIELLNTTDDEQLRTEFYELKEKATKELDTLETRVFLSGKYDASDAILSIHSGQGGTEAMDWASMLSRMYQRYFERKGWSVDFVEESRGEDAGIKSATFIVHGEYAYGLLKHEAGAHRLVRLSPFNADNLRQTSFSGVEVAPLISDESSEIEVKPDDLEWQFTRAGGHGGQNVNKVNTAVILKHIPSGLIVECREERYQEQNKKLALSILKSKLAQIEEERRLNELASLKGEHKIAGWGNQIRNYVLHPYHLVKDTRTKVETSDTQGVLDGDIDLFTQ